MKAHEKARKEHGHMLERICAAEGRIAGEAGGVNLVLRNDQLTGVLQSMPANGPPSTFLIWPLGGGLHALVCADHSKSLPD